jgi:hypothetical protein
VLVSVGGTGTGKAHLATAIGMQASTQHGHRVRFFSTATLTNSLDLEKAAGKQGRTSASFTHLGKRGGIVRLEKFHATATPLGRVVASRRGYFHCGRGSNTHGQGGDASTCRHSQSSFGPQVARSLPAAQSSRLHLSTVAQSRATIHPWPILTAHG